MCSNFDILTIFFFFFSFFFFQWKNDEYFYEPHIVFEQDRIVISLENQ